MRDLARGTVPRRVHLRSAERGVRAQNSGEAIRFITRQDAKVLWKLAWSYLRETAKHGGDWLPTPENASRMVQIAMGEADQGLPCFLAEVRGRAVGFAIAWELKPLLETKGKICQELWIYVDPRYRGGTLAAKFRCLGLDVAQSQGYTRTDAFSMNQRVPVGSRFRMILFSFMHTEG